MSLDTKYRPEKFEEVLGQNETVQILKNLLQKGEIFQKSYIFAGPSGTGKTTTARILARAMLCDDLSDKGEPCGQCESCEEILKKGQSHAFKEMDAANHSGKEHIQKILQNMKYYTLDGNDRRIYLIDESHRLSKAAMDALLKPMEDNVPGSQDKRLVCLFCTTEPEKLRTTIKTRCMLFPIQEPNKEDVVDRLSYICEEEGFSYDREALEIIYQQGGGHIRDMINALEKVGRVGEISLEKTKNQLGLSAYSNYFDVLFYLGDDIDAAISSMEEALNYTDPPSVYDGLSEVAMSSYKLSEGVGGGMTYGKREKAERVGEKHGSLLLEVVDRILDSKKSIDFNSLYCEIFFLHRILKGDSFSTRESKELVENAQYNEKKGERGEEEGSDEPDQSDKSDKTYSDGESTEYAEMESVFGSHFQNKDKEGKKKEKEDKGEIIQDQPAPPRANEDDIKSIWDT